jgi:lysophospholipase L1-like esterase
VLGDSIARGDEASSRETSFVGILARELRATTSYFCRGGATSETGVEWAPYVWTTPKPDLTLISYGMNDQTVSGRLRRRASVEPERYGANIARIVELQRDRGSGGFLLVAPPAPHPDWNGASGRVAEYRDALLLLGEPVADVLPLWDDPRRLIVNGRNHPGDEGHRLIADACLAVLRAV